VLGISTTYNKIFVAFDSRGRHSLASEGKLVVEAYAKRPTIFTTDKGVESSCKKLATMKDGDKPGRCMYIHNGLIYAGGEDQYVRIWDTETFAQKTSFEVKSRGVVHSIHVTDGKIYVGTVNSDNLASIEIWNESVQILPFIADTALGTKITYKPCWSSRLDLFVSCK
jgi:outer membrane protein assembly factor BamB